MLRSVEPETNIENKRRAVSGGSLQQLHRQHHALRQFLSVCSIHRYKRWKEGKKEKEAN